VTIGGGADEWAAVLFPFHPVLISVVHVPWCSGLAAARGVSESGKKA